MHMRRLFKSHLAFIFHGHMSPPPLQSSHARCMQDYFSNLTLHPSCVAKCPLHHTKVFTRDACEMTFHISSHIHLAWPSVPSTTSKVTSHKYFSPCVTILISHPPRVSPPCKNNIFHLAWKNSQKVTQQPPFHQ